MIFIQEEVEQRTVSLTISAVKFSGRILKAAITKYLAHRKEIEQQRNTARPPEKYGRVSMEELQAQYGDLHKIDVEDKNTRLFERIARQYKVQYRVSKLAEGKYEVFFKAPNDAAMQSAFMKFSAKKIKRESRPSVLEKLQKFKSLVKAPVLDKQKKKELEL